MWEFKKEEMKNVSRILGILLGEWSWNEVGVRSFLRHIQLEMSVRHQMTRSNRIFESGSQLGDLRWRYIFEDFQ